MLNKTQIEEIKKHLENSQNPLFFFDNDADGLCSFLILQRTMQRGKGVPVKSSPELNSSYLRKINELNPDAVFVLDKPKVSMDFIDGVKEKNLPLIWIDHHNVDVENEKKSKVYYYNSYPSSEPVTYISQKVFNRQEDLWIAMIGCVADAFMPDFAEKFSQENPEIFPMKKDMTAFDAIHTTELGKIIRMLNFGLMDKTTNVILLMKLLIKSKNIYDIVEENPKTKQFHRRYEELNYFLQKQINKAEKQKDSKSKLLLFTYSGEMSMSSEISNAIYFKNKDKFIVVAYKRPEKINLSIRGKNARKIVLSAIENIDGAVGGGHEEACGAMLPPDKLDDFKKNVEKLLN